MKLYVLRYPDGSLVGIDRDSGGYPYKAWNESCGHSPRGVAFFAFTEYGKEQALDYCSSSDNFELAVFEFTVTDA